MIHPQKQQTSFSKVELFVDFLMLFLISINLGWILFDALFESTSFQSFILWLSPEFHQAYLVIHEDFLKYDLIFISLYLIEFMSRWGIALVKKTYDRWFLFPLYHWYDILGCIPLGAFQMLRILRLVVLFKKLNELQIINLNHFYLYHLYKKYLAIATEEISDRVVVQVLDGVTKELQQGTPILHQIVDKALLPQQQDLSTLLSNSMTHFIHEAYDLRKTSIQNAVLNLVQQAALKSQNLSQLKAVPLVGNQMNRLLEETISDMVFEVTDQIVDYLRSDLSTEVIEDALEVSFKHLSNPESDANHLVQAILLDTIKVIKSQVQIQQWKVNYEPLNPINTND